MKFQGYSYAKLWAWNSMNILNIQAANTAKLYQENPRCWNTWIFKNIQARKS